MTTTEAIEQLRQLPPDGELMVVHQGEALRVFGFEVVSGGIAPALIEVVCGENEMA